MKHSIQTGLGLLLVGLMMTGTEALAQDATVLRVGKSRSISIENGQLFIDGKAVPEKEMPSSLNLSRYKGAYKFSFLGDGNDTYIAMAGGVYTLRGDRLLESKEEPGDNNLSVYFSSSENNFPVRFMKRDDFPVVYDVQGQEVHGWTADFNGTYKNAMHVLQQQAEELNRMTVQLADQDNHVDNVFVRRLADEAENTARMAVELPRIEMKAYLQDIQEADRSLYDRLVQEHQLEVESQQLAMSIREATSSREQQRLMNDLRAKLMEAFRFKQENREKEIQQLSKRLDDLRDQLDQREKLHTEIIETRLQQLVSTRIN